MKQRVIALRSTSDRDIAVNVVGIFANIALCAINCFFYVTTGSFFNLLIVPVTIASAGIAAHSTHVLIKLRRVHRALERSQHYLRQYEATGDADLLAPWASANQELEHIARKEFPEWRKP